MFVIVTYCHDITHNNYNMISSQAATEREEQPEVKDLIRLAQRMTVVSWCTYPFVYIIPYYINMILQVNVILRPEVLQLPPAAP